MDALLSGVWYKFLVCFLYVGLGGLNYPLVQMQMRATDDLPVMFEVT